MASFLLNSPDLYGWNAERANILQLLHVNAGRQEVTGMWQIDMVPRSQARLQFGNIQADAGRRNSILFASRPCIPYTHPDL